MNHKFFLFSSLLLFFSLTVAIFTSSINSSLSFFFYKKIGDNDDDNNYSSSSSGGKSFNVTIPKGSANPEVDITKLGPRQWYFPRQLTIHTNDTIKWINQDTEAHTVTSGVGAGIESLINNKRGTLFLLLLLDHPEIL
jgi:hypothetical protein